MVIVIVTTHRHELDPERVKQVRTSYTRCRNHEEFIPRFYERLWTYAPKVRRHFAHTDMEQQHLVMREAINSLLMYAQGSVVAGMAIERLAKVHSRSGRNVPPSLHDTFARALVEVVAEIDEHADDELLESWRVTLQPGLERIASAY